MGERRLVLQIFKNFWESLKPRQITGIQVGKDYFGNTYHEIPADPRRGKRRPSRWFTPTDPDAFDQEMPAEWEAWLRGRREAPPTEEEVMKSLALMKLKKKNAAELEEKYQTKKLSTLDPPKTGYESFPKYSDYEISPGESRDKKN